MKLKFGITLIALFFLGCANTNIISSTESLDYNKVRGFVVGASGESDVIKALGAPASRIDEKDYYTLNYDDLKTGSQRLSINFFSESQKISSLLWLPNRNEKEYSLAQAKAGFKNAEFKEVITKIKNPHMISPPEISYIDEKSGVTIRYNQVRNVVEAIAIYSINSRLPADTDKRNQIPFTFGDEAVTSK